MKIFKSPTFVDIAEIVTRPYYEAEQLNETIDYVFDEVLTRGDEALIEFTRKYDGVEISEVEVSKDEIRASTSQISKELKQSIHTACDNIVKFHKAQNPKEIEVTIQDGIKCWQKPVPISTVGIYIPGGSAPLFSTVLMLAIPASIAGCREVIMCTPPGKDGKVHPATLYAAHICQVSKVFKVGGSQAIAAMSLGSTSVKPVNKIFGPGNQYVTAAKLKAFQNGIAIDMPAGPSEVLVFTDETGQPEYIAADLLSQAEHGPDSQVVMITTNEDMIEAVKKEVENQLEFLPRREIAREALKNSSLVYVSNRSQAFKIINQYAPEHLIIASDHADEYLDFIINAGSVFVGNYTPESAGDYASGTNHTLPTAAAAKAFSGVNVDSFYKKITFQEITKKGLQDLGPSIMTMAREEQLEGHAQAVERRLKL